MTLDLWYDYYFFLWSNKSAVLLFFLVIRVGRLSDVNNNNYLSPLG